MKNRLLAALALTLVSVYSASAQTTERRDRFVAAQCIGIATSPATCSVSNPLQVVGLPSTLTIDKVLVVDASGNVGKVPSISQGLTLASPESSSGQPSFIALGRGHLPSAIAYEDEANTFSGTQTITTGGILDIYNNAYITNSAGTLRLFDPVFLDGRLTIRRNADTTKSMFIDVASTGSVTIDLNTASQNFLIQDKVTLANILEINGGYLNATSVSLTIAPDLNLNLTPASTLTIDALDDLVTVNDNIQLLAGTPGVGTSIGTDNYVSRTTGFKVDYQGAADFRTIFANEMKVSAFTTDLTQATNGDLAVTKASTTVAQAFTCPASAGAATLWVYDFPSAANVRVFSSGDQVSVQFYSRTDADSDGATDLTLTNCVGTVTTYTDASGATEGQQSWSFTRGTGANGGGASTGAVAAVNAVVIDYGTTSNGILYLTANDGAEGVNAPYLQIATWATAPIPTNWTARARLGNLKGITSTTEWGLLAGTYSATNGQYFRASDQAFELHGIDLTLWQSTTAVIALRRNSGAPYLAIGAALPTAYGTGTGIWMGNDSGTYKFRVGNPSGNRLQWDGTNLQLGDTSDDYIQMDTTNGLSLFEGGVRRAQLDTSGNLILGAVANSSTRITVDPTNGFRIIQRSAGGSDTTKVTFATDGTFNILGTGTNSISYNGTTLSIRGALTADDITAGTLTGRTVQSTANCGTSGGACTKLTTAGLYTYDSGNAEQISVTSADGIQIAAASSGGDYPKLIRFNGTPATLAGVWNSAFHINAQGNIHIGEAAINTYTSTVTKVFLISDNGVTSAPGCGSVYLSVDATDSTAAVRVQENDCGTAVVPNFGAAGFYNTVGWTSTSGTSLVDCGNYICVSSSSARYKEHVQPLVPALADLKAALWALKPVSFDYKRGPDAQKALGERGRHGTGYIAEDVAGLGLLKDLVVWDAQNRPDGLLYDRLGVYLLPVLKDQDARLADLQTQVRTLTARITKLEQQGGAR